MGDILQEKDIIEPLIDLYETGGGKTYYLGFSGLAKHYSIKEGGCTDWVGYATSGKCLGKGTKVVMFNGTLKKVEDIKVGDKLMGVDSKPRNVLSLARGREQMYWIRQNRGIDYRVNESHILSLRKNKHTYGRNKTLAEHNKKHTLVNLSVKDYINSSKYQKSILKGWKKGVDFKSRDLEIEPYFIGVWLGDGSTEDIVIHNPEQEIKDYLYQYANRIGLSVTTLQKNDRCPCHRVKGDGGRLVKQMRKMNLIGNKHIPDDYLYNSEENRLQLLAGLLDTDGYLASNCGYEITQKSEKLIRQIKFLCDSLGFHTTLTKKYVTLNGNKRLYWRLTISINRTDIPLRVERKKPIKKSNSIYTGIKVEKDIVDDYYGFTIDGDSLFLLEDFTVTHNTTMLLECLKNTYEWYGHRHLIYMPDAGSNAEVIGDIIHKVTGKQFDEFYYDSDGNKVAINNRIEKDEIIKILPKILDAFKVYIPVPKKGEATKSVTPKEYWTFAAENKKELGIFSAVIDSWNYMRHDTEGFSREDKWLEDTLSFRNDLAERSKLHFHTIIHPKSAKKDKDGKIVMPDYHEMKGGSEWGNNGKSIVIVHRDFDSNQTVVKVDKAKPKIVGVKGVTTLNYDISKGAYYEYVMEKTEFGEKARKKYAEKDPINAIHKPMDYKPVTTVNDNFDNENKEDIKDDLPF